MTIKIIFSSGEHNPLELQKKDRRYSVALPQKRQRHSIPWVNYKKRRLHHLRDILDLSTCEHLSNDF